MKLKKEGDIPINARINIKYNGIKPKISFGYPQKNSQVRGSYFWWLRIFGIGLWTILYICWFFGNIMLDSSDYLSRNYDKTELQKFSECVAIHPVETLTNYTGIRYDICEPLEDFVLIDWELLQVGISFICFFWIIPAAIYFPFKKKWNKLYPKTEAFFSSKKFRVFKKKDMIKDRTGIYIELPIFSNVICNFHATKDFSKYLKEFTIREYEFYYYKKKKIRIGKVKKKFWKKNEWIWYARWYFTQEPKLGEIKVIFK